VRVSSSSSSSPGGGGGGNGGVRGETSPFVTPPGLFVFLPSGVKGDMFALVLSASSSAESAEAISMSSEEMFDSFSSDILRPRSS
jgi:hypothetical protein